MGPVFVSYSRRDHAFADALTSDLGAHGFEVWMDRTGIRGGEDFAARIADAIERCSAFLLLLSGTSVASKHVDREVRLAADADRFIVPLRLEPCELSGTMKYYVQGLEIIDFSAGAAVKPGRGPVVELMETLETIRSVPAAPATTSSGPMPAAFPPPTTSNPFPAPPPAAPAPPTPLPGRWVAQIAHPMLGIGATLTVDLFPNGTFRGQLAKPMGTTVVQGQWQTGVNNQLMMQGYEGDGFQVGPYMVVWQFTQITPNQMAGASSVGEQTVWQRVQ